MRPRKRKKAHGRTTLHNRKVISGIYPLSHPQIRTQIFTSYNKGVYSRFQEFSRYQRFDR